MREVAGSRLILRAGFLSVAAVRDEIVRQFVAAGIAADRIELRGATDRAGVLATYHDIDIALDPGVPVISLRGDRFSGRVGESILTTIGLAELVVADPAAYRDAAVALARDLPRLADL